MYVFFLLDDVELQQQPEMTMADISREFIESRTPPPRQLYGKRKVLVSSGMSEFLPKTLNGLSFFASLAINFYNQIFTNAALTHTSRPYCDLKTSKIAFFFRKSFGFLSKFLSQTVRGSAVLCSVRFLYVFNTPRLRPWRFHCDYIAFPRRPHGDHRRPRCD